MALKKITYNGSSKVIINLCKMVNQLIDAGSPSASDVSYDNTGSGLSAENVQDAIDEVNGDIPTKTSDLTNDSGFITNAVNNLANYYLKSETYTQAEVDALISAISTMHFEVVQTLPVSDIQTNVIYLVPSSDPGTQNIYDEYINTTGTSAGWELIGSTQVDLSDYVTTQDLSDALADYVTSANLTTILAGYVESADLATVATTGDYDDLTNKPTIPAAQVQSDWNQADSTAVDYIKNKPSIPSGGVTDVEVNGTSVVSGGVASVTVPTALSDLSEDSTHRTVTDTEKSTWNGKVSDNPTFTEASTRANIASGESFATILGKIKKFFTDLKTVAFTGAYADLTGTPDLTNVAYKNTYNGFTANQGINRADGTSSTVGYSDLYLGNGTASGTDGNSTGRIIMYGSGTKYTVLETVVAGTNKTIDFPNASGTVALTSNIPTDFVSKANGGTFDNNISVVKKNAGTGSVPSRVTVGNGTPDGTAGASHGNLLIYDRGSRYAEIRTPNNLTAIRIIYLPDKAGTLALTTDIETKTVKSSTTLTYNTQIASELSPGSGDNLTLFTLSNGMRVMNGLFLVIATEATPTDKLFDMPSDYRYTHEGYSNQYWITATNVITKESYTVRITSAAYPWGVSMPLGTYLIHAVF